MAQDALADEGVLAHEGPLGIGERAGLAEDGVWDGGLADVVQFGGAADLVGLLGGEGEVAGGLTGEISDVGEVSVQGGLPLAEDAEQHVAGLPAG